MVLSSDEDMPLDALCLTYEMNVRKIKFFFHIYRKKYIFIVKNLPLQKSPKPPKNKVKFAGSWRRPR